MSDNWNPPPGRDPSEPEGEQPTGEEGTSRRDGQSPRWWTESADKQQEYLRPDPQHPAPPPAATPGPTQWYSPGLSDQPGGGDTPQQPGTAAGATGGSAGGSSAGGSSAGRTSAGPAGGNPGGTAGGNPGGTAGGQTPPGPAPGGNPGWNLPPYSQSAGSRGQHSAPPPTGPRHGTGEGSYGRSYTGNQPPSTPVAGTPAAGRPASTSGTGAVGPGTPPAAAAGASGAGTPSAGAPGASTLGPRTPTPGTRPTAPGTSSAGALGPHIPTAGASGAGTPSSGRPTDASGAGTPGTGTPGTGAPGSRTPGVGAAGVGTTSSWPSASTGPVLPQSGSSWPGPTGQQPPQGGNPWSGATPAGQPPAYQQQSGQQGWQQPPSGGPGGQQSGQPAWQYPPIPIPQPPGPGRRRKPRQLSRGLLIGLVVLAVILVGSGVTALIQLSKDDATVPVAVETPSPTPSETPSETPSLTPSPTPTPTPPPKPKPKPRQLTPYEVVAKNKIYSVGVLQPTKCVEPPYRPTTFEATKAYYNRLLPCLNRTWWLALKKSGQPFRAPHVIVYANQVKTPCGTERGTRGFYCAANEAIYMPFNVDYKNYKVNPMYTRAWMLNTFAHEYGHHIQQLTGIFRASFQRQATMADPNLRLLESRRRELQASCLGSAYLGINAPYIPLRGELLNSWKFAVANAGDEFSKPKVRDHGSKVNHNRWSIRGFTYKNPIFCNTFDTNPQYTS